jgi:hypothetical protein
MVIQPSMLVSGAKFLCARWHVLAFPAHFKVSVIFVAAVAANSQAFRALIFQQG